MAERVKLMRNQLVCKLQDLGTPGKWDHINKQVGMFSYTGLTGKSNNKFYFWEYLKP